MCLICLHILFCGICTIQFIHTMFWTLYNVFFTQFHLFVITKMCSFKCILWIQKLFLVTEKCYLHWASHTISIQDVFYFVLRRCVVEITSNQWTQTCNGCVPNTFLRKFWKMTKIRSKFDQRLLQNHGLLGRCTPHNSPFNHAATDLPQTSGTYSPKVCPGRPLELLRSAPLFHPFLFFSKYMHFWRVQVMFWVPSTGRTQGTRWHPHVMH